MQEYFLELKIAPVSSFVNEVAEEESFLSSSDLTIVITLLPVEAVILPHSLRLRSPVNALALSASMIL